MKYLIIKIRMDGKRTFEVVEAADIEKAANYAIEDFEPTLVGFKSVTRKRVIHLTRYSLSGRPLINNPTCTRKFIVRSVPFTEYRESPLPICTDFAELQNSLTPLLKGDEKVYENDIVAVFRPSTCNYFVRMAYTHNCGELLLTFSIATSYPRIFVGSSLADCIQQAQDHYSVMKQF